LLLSSFAKRLRKDFSILNGASPPLVQTNLSIDFWGVTVQWKALVLSSEECKGFKTRHDFLQNPGANGQTEPYNKPRPQPSTSFSHSLPCT